MRGVQKFNRAQAHLADLHRLIDEYKAQVAGVTYAVSTAEDGGIECRRGDVPAPPVEIGLALGDFLQAARASLDHAIYAISTAIHPEFERTSFPIALDEPAYEELAGRFLICVPGEIRDAVRRFQPFANGGGRGDPLWRMHEMAIIDRHREITLLASVVATEGVGWTRTGPLEEDPDIRIYRPAVSAGELLCRVPSRVQEPSGRFTPDIGLSVVVGEGDRLSDGPEVFGLATEIRGRVWAALYELDRVAGQLTEPRDVPGAD
jgi:hypothetical protein